MRQSYVCVLSIVPKASMAPKHPRQKQAGDAVSAWPNTMLTHVLECSIIADLWRRGNSTRTSDAAGCSALGGQLSMRFVGCP